MRVFESWKTKEEMIVVFIMGHWKACIAYFSISDNKSPSSRLNDFLPPASPFFPPCTFGCMFLSLLTIGLGPLE